MIFELLPVVDTMMALYAKPRSIERFKEYLNTLQGGAKNGLQLPITGFNPMAREHILENLFQLKKLDIENIMLETLTELNEKARSNYEYRYFKVSFNLIDDIKGAWSNRYITEYDSKFKLTGLIRNNFCTPVFWASEEYTIEKIRFRTLEYCHRTIYWLGHHAPSNLQDHVEQELFITKEMNLQNPFHKIEYKKLLEYYNIHKHSDNYNLIFNFFFGNEACKSLEFPCFGIENSFF